MYEIATRPANIAADCDQHMMISSLRNVHSGGRGDDKTADAAPDHAVIPETIVMPFNEDQITLTPLLWHTTVSIRK